MSVELYGLRRCRKTQKAVAWLNAQNISFNFHDFGLQGIDVGKLSNWIARVGYIKLLNTKSPLFRRAPLEVNEEGSINAETQARTLMQTEPRLINRPVLEYNTALVIGFNPELYVTLFLARSAD